MDASAPVHLNSANGPGLRTSVATAPEKFLRKTFAAGSGSAVGASVGLAINVFHGHVPPAYLRRLRPLQGCFTPVQSVGGFARAVGSPNPGQFCPIRPDSD